MKVKVKVGLPLVESIKHQASCLEPSTAEFASFTFTSFHFISFWIAFWMACLPATSSPPSQHLPITITITFTYTCYTPQLDTYTATKTPSATPAQPALRAPTPTPSPTPTPRNPTSFLHISLISAIRNTSAADARLDLLGGAVPAPLPPSCFESSYSNSRSAHCDRSDKSVAVEFE